MPVADVDRLVADARLILEYAVRAGKLPDDALASAIQEMERSDSAQNIIALQNAMNAVVAHIAPMTLVDLRAGRNPFDQRNVHARSRWQIGLSMATLWLIAAIAYYQYLVQQQETALRAYREVAEARGSERLTEVRMLVQRRQALSKDSCQEDQYQKARHDLRQLADRAVVATNSLVELSKASPWPFVDSINLTYNFAKDAIWHAESASALASVPQSQSAIAISSAQTAVPPYAQGAENVDLCDEGQWTKLLPTGYPSWLRTVVLDSLDEFCFANKLSIDRLGVADPFRLGNSPYGPKVLDYDPVAKVEQRMRVQTGWLLPFLYGLLGACVYVMRRLLFDTKGAAVENVVIVLRLALGALAGVAIGWFAIPAAPSSAYASASSWPYVLAFLAGFSIDILFALLDRANRVLVDKTQTTA